MDSLHLLEDFLIASSVSFEETSVSQADSQPCKTRTYIINYAHVYSVKAIVLLRFDVTKCYG